MNWDQLEGKWHQIAGSAKERWGKMTDDDWKTIAGKRENLVGHIQERYGVAKEEAERQAEEWSTRFSEAAQTGQTQFGGSPKDQE